MSKQNVPVVTIDGPSGTGKGTICHMLADHLGWHALDSGVLYRVMAYAAKKHHVVFSNVDALVTLAQDLNLRCEGDVEHGSRVFYEGEEIGTTIRTEEWGQEASRVGVIRQVREALLARQRAFAIPPGLVTDGRDMGTVVFPQAMLKIYLSASVEKRAQRRYLQLKEKGNDVSLAQVITELSKRDARDVNRVHAPLKPAPDAVEIDTSQLTVVQVFNNVLQLIDRLLTVN